MIDIRSIPMDDRHALLSREQFDALSHGKPHHLTTWYHNQCWKGGGHCVVGEVWRECWFLHWFEFTFDHASMPVIRARIIVIGRLKPVITDNYGSDGSGGW